MPRSFTILTRIQGLSPLGSIVKSYDDIVPSLKYLLTPRSGFEPASFIVGTDSNESVFHVAAGAYFTQRVPGEVTEIFKFLLTIFHTEEYLEVMETKSNQTPLVFAVLANNVEAAKELIAAGANLDAGYPNFTVQDANLVYALATFKGVVGKGTDPYETLKFATEYSEMIRLLKVASEKPKIFPKLRLVEDGGDSLAARITRFFELAKLAGLSTATLRVSDNPDDQVDTLSLPPDVVLTGELMSKIVSALLIFWRPEVNICLNQYVGKDVISEAEVLCHKDIRSTSPFFIPLSGYLFTRKASHLRYGPMLLMSWEGVIGPLDNFFNDNPATLEERIILCHDVVAAVELLHNCGFVHGLLRPSNVLIVKLEERQGRSKLAKLWNFDDSVGPRTPPPGQVYRRQESVFDAPEIKDNETTQMPFDSLKKCELFSLGVLILQTCGAGKFNAPGNVESNPNFLATAAANAWQDVKDEELRKFLTRTISEIVTGMTARVPEKRKVDLGGVRRKFNQCLQAIEIRRAFSDSIDDEEAEKYLSLEDITVRCTADEMREILLLLHRHAREDEMAETNEASEIENTDELARQDSEASAIKNTDELTCQDIKALFVICTTDEMRCLVEAVVQPY
jgi:hypothetical protein